MDSDSLCAGIPNWMNPVRTGVVVGGLSATKGLEIRKERGPTYEATNAADRMSKVVLAPPHMPMHAQDSTQRHTLRWHCDCRTSDIKTIPSGQAGVRLVRNQQRHPYPFSRAYLKVPARTLIELVCEFLRTIPNS